MKLLLLHCRKIEAQKAWETNTWEKALMVLVCPEKKDGAEAKKDALTQILESLGYLKENKIVLVPFPYISVDASTSEELQKFIQWLQKKLEKKEYITAQFDFENSERISIGLIGHRLSVAFREVGFKNEDIGV